MSITCLNYRFMCVPYEGFAFGGFDLLLCVLLACQVRVTVGDSGNVSITCLNFMCTCLLRMLLLVDLIYYSVFYSHAM